MKNSDKNVEGRKWFYLSSVHKLFCFIIIDSVYFQKWIWFAEEVLQKQNILYKYAVDINALFLNVA